MHSPPKSSICMPDQKGKNLISDDSGGLLTDFDASDEKLGTPSVMEEENMEEKASKTFRPAHMSTQQSQADGESDSDEKNPVKNPQQQVHDVQESHEMLSYVSPQK